LNHGKRRKKGKYVEKFIELTETRSIPHQEKETDEEVKAVVSPPGE